MKDSELAEIFSKANGVSYAAALRAVFNAGVASVQPRPWIGGIVLDEPKKTPAKKKAVKKATKK